MLFDSRIEQVRKIVEAIIPKTLQQYTNVLVNSNTLVLNQNNTLLYNIPLKGIAEIYPPIAFNYWSIVEFEDPNSYIDDRFILDGMVKMNLYYESIKQTCPLVAYDANIRQNEEFENLLSLKSDERLRYFKMPGINPNDTFLIPMFAGFISLSKQDEMGMKVYAIDDQFLLLEMDIFKKKINRNYSVCCRIMRI